MTNKKILALIAILALASLVVPGAVAEEEEEEEDEERVGFGEQEREREQEGKGEFGEQEREEEDEGRFSSQYSGIILYITIAGIIAAFSYTAYKIYRSRSLKKLQ
jgi:hypothetical protein